MARNRQSTLSGREYATMALVAFLMFGAAGSVRFVGVIGRAMADESADVPLPEITPAQLAAKIREAMGRYDGKGLFRVVFTDTHDTNFNPNQAGHGLLPRPGPVRERRHALACGIRLDVPRYGIDPVEARSVVDRVRRHPGV